MLDSITIRQLRITDWYFRLGIDPPRGVLLYGAPGTGKTMLAKAVAHHTDASFIRVVGSEFVQKYLGEGPRMVRYRVGSLFSLQIPFLPHFPLSLIQGCISLGKGKCSSHYLY